MKPICERNAEALSYLQGLGPVGTWVAPRNKHMASDIGVSHSHLCLLLDALVAQGFVERRAGWNVLEYRVIKRLESRDVVQVNSRSRRATALELTL